MALFKSAASDWLAADYVMCRIRPVPPASPIICGSHRARHHFNQCACWTDSGDKHEIHPLNETNADIINDTETAEISSVFAQRVNICCIGQRFALLSRIQLPYTVENIRGCDPSLTTLQHATLGHYD